MDSKEVEALIGAGKKKMSYTDNEEIGNLGGYQAIVTAWYESGDSIIPKGIIKKTSREVDVKDKIDWYIERGGKIVARVQTRVTLITPSSNFEKNANVQLACGPMRNLPLKTMQNELEVFSDYSGDIPTFFLYGRYYKRAGDAFLFQSLWLIDIARIKSLSEDEIAGLHTFTVPNSDGTISSFINIPATHRIRG